MSRGKKENQTKNRRACMRTMSLPTTEKGVQGMWDVVVQNDFDMELAIACPLQVLE